MGPVIEELGRTLEKIFQDKVSGIDTSVAKGLWFLGERQDLLEIIGNVMENACKWCAAEVRVTAAALDGAPRRFALAVEDDGAGLAAEQRQTVLRRGQRLDENAPGSGLGLSIVDELVRAYGGALSLSESDLGGLKVTLTLPRAEG